MCAAEERVSSASECVNYFYKPQTRINLHLRNALTVPHPPKLCLTLRLPIRASPSLSLTLSLLHTLNFHIGCVLGAYCVFRAYSLRIGCALGAY